jgi:hypothetical protein
MRTTRWIALVAALASALATVPASAHDLRELRKEHGDLPEVVRLVELHRELHVMLERYEAAEARAGRAWVAAAAMAREAEAARDLSDEAARRLEERVRAAYQFGPGGRLEALLGASSLADLATISEFSARAISVDDEILRETIVADAVLAARRGMSEAARAGVAGRLERLRGMLDVLRSKVDEASDLAEQARIEDERLASLEKRVAGAVQRAGSWDLGVIDYRQDQSHLLALLGPTGGQTCDTPGLVETGESFSGYASWYGWEFGGQPTATGAIFDPRLFTAANRWLPFGSFLRVRHGDRCAIVLINDRGPYGRLERVIDLSQAAAQYLGVGVSWVDAEILVPRDGLPS